MERAKVTIEELPGGPRVTIEYEDGHTVWISPEGGNSLILRLHLGLEDEAAQDAGQPATVRRLVSGQ